MRTNLHKLRTHCWHIVDTLWTGIGHRLWLEWNTLDRQQPLQQPATCQTPEQSQPHDEWIALSRGQTLVYYSMFHSHNWLQTSLMHRLQLQTLSDATPSIKKTSRESQNGAKRTSHQLSSCQNVLTKGPFKLVFLLINGIFHKSSFATILKKFCHNLSFWVLSKFEVKFWFLEFCHNLSFVTILVVEFCNILSFF